MHKVPTLKQTRQIALQGRADEAISLLRNFADRGDASASASLAELLAFKNEWQECVQRAGEFIARPQSVYAGNIFDDMIRLLGCAGQATKRWDWILRVVQTAEDNLEENIAEYVPAKQEAQRNRYGKIFQALRNYAQRKGAPPHELIRVFGVAERTQTENDHTYLSASESLLQKCPDLRDKPDVLIRHSFALAQLYNQRLEAIQRFEAGQMPADFDCAVFVAKAFVLQEQPEQAWEILSNHINLWWPLDHAQVAPVILLVDRELNGLMNRERCEKVLALPRGPESNYRSVSQHH